MSVVAIGLFDGLGALRVALDILGIPVLGYMSVEKNGAARRVAWWKAISPMSFAGMTSQHYLRWSCRGWLVNFPKHLLWSWGEVHHAKASVDSTVTGRERSRTNTPACFQKSLVSEICVKKSSLGVLSILLWSLLLQWTQPTGTLCQRRSASGQSSVMPRTSPGATVLGCFGATGNWSKALGFRWLGQRTMVRESCGLRRPRTFGRWSVQVGLRSLPNKHFQLLPHLVLATIQEGGRQVFTSAHKLIWIGGFLILIGSHLISIVWSTAWWTSKMKLAFPMSVSVKSCLVSPWGTLLRVVARRSARALVTTTSDSHC